VDLGLGREPAAVEVDFDWVAFFIVRVWDRKRPSNPPGGRNPCSKAGIAIRQKTVDLSRPCCFLRRSSCERVEHTFGTYRGGVTKEALVSPRYQGFWGFATHFLRRRDIPTCHNARDESRNELPHAMTRPKANCNRSWSGQARPSPMAFGRGARGHPRQRIGTGALRFGRSSARLARWRRRLCRSGVVRDSFG
jgi:hypothetical protein